MALTRPAARKEGPILSIRPLSLRRLSRTLTLFAALAALPIAVAAQTLIAADAEMTDAYRQLRDQLEQRRATPSFDQRLATEGHRFLLPLYQVDRANPWGEATLLSLRNTGREAASLEIAYYDRAAKLVRSDRVALGPAEVRSVNLRDLPELRAEGDGFARGFAIVTADGPISADLLQVDPAQDFATGERLTRLTADSWCALWDTRFVNGGSFSGGTELTLLLGDPLGTQARRDGEGAIFEVFDEKGTSWGVVYFFSNQAVSRLHVADILAALPAAPTFGAIEVLFMPDTGGGMLYADFRAEGRYAASLPGSCMNGG